MPVATLLRAGRVLLAVAAIGVLGLLGDDAWRWLLSGDALERAIGLRVDAQLQLHIRLVPVAPGDPARAAGPAARARTPRPALGVPLPS